MRRTTYQLAMLVTVAVIGGRVLNAKDKHAKAKPEAAQDQIVVDSQIPNSEGPVTRFIATRHYDRSYVYAERGSGKPVTLIDVTNPRHPEVLSQGMFPVPSGHLVAVAGTAALAGDAEAETSPATPQTIRVLDFSDPTKPTVTNQFDQVTAIQNVSGGLILLANGEGIWILSQHLAEDPAAEERYARKVVYGESMY